MDGNLTCAEAATAAQPRLGGAGFLEDAVTAAPDPEPVSDDLGCSDDDPSARAPPCRPPTRSLVEVHTKLGNQADVLRMEFRLIYWAWCC